jgi:hypothetical protein
LSVSQAAQLAKAAREKLASALNALQTEADVPDALMDVAEPIAQAMGVLHRVERSSGADLEGRDKALDAVRRALDLLQKIEVSHAAVDACLEAVAASLAKVHALAKIQPQAAAPAAAPAPAPAPVAAPAPAPAPAPVAAPAAAPAVAPAPAPAPAPAAWPPAAAIAPAPASPSTGPSNTQVIPAAPGAAPLAIPPAPAVAPSPASAAAPSPASAAPASPAPAVAPSPAPSPAPRVQGGTLMMPKNEAAPAPAAAAPAAVAPAPQPAPTPAAVQAHQHQPVAAPSRGSASSAPVAAPSATARASSAPAGSVVVELGAHSVSNFYKGLSGNDVIEHGGIFVGTYKVPKIGTEVSLRVLLPGDYEFHASGVVQWVRDPSDGVDPGFGAKLTQITPEGRQLVYRYARNREPLFYDDL